MGVNLPGPSLSLRNVNSTDFAPYKVGSLW